MSVTVDDGESTTEFTAVWQVMAPTAIHFGGISAKAVGDAIEVAWDAGSDGELNGFRVYRTTVAETAPNWVSVSQFIPVSGRTSDDYDFLDERVVPGILCRYMLALYDSDGVVAEYITGPVMVGTGNLTRQYLPMVASD